jgi:hypothetical protein
VQRAAELALEAAASATSLPVTVQVNAPDDVGAGRLYFTVTGTSGMADRPCISHAVGVPSAPEAFSLCGFILSDLIAFCVSFTQHESVTAWAGQQTIVAGRERIETLWHLAKNIPDEDEARGLWAGILAGADVFERG